MAKRKIIVNETEYLYKVGSRFTKIDKVGTYRNMDIGDVVDLSQEVCAVRPFHIRQTILKSLQQPEIYHELRVSPRSLYSDRR